MALYKVKLKIDDTNITYYAIANKPSYIINNHSPKAELSFEEIASDVEDLNPL